MEIREGQVWVPRCSTYFKGDHRRYYNTIVVCFVEVDGCMTRIYSSQGGAFTKEQIIQSHELFYDPTLKGYGTSNMHLADANGVLKTERDEAHREIGRLTLELNKLRKQHKAK